MPISKNRYPYYAEKHPIPPDLEYSIPGNLPWDESFPNRDSIVTECDTNSWLMLYGNLACYDWDFYYPALPDGILYLRLFEVTKNEPLSYEQIKKETKTYVSNHTAFGHIISPDSEPPVCKVMNYQKYLYELKKKQKEIKAKAAKVVVKEIHLGPNTNEHDFDFKVKHAAAEPSIAIPLYEQFIDKMQESFSSKIQTGIFGADMQVQLVNDGPVTIIIDTKQKE